MSIKQPPETIFSFSFGRLVIVANEKASFMERDAAEFALRGVDAADITAFRDQTEEFDNLKTDEEYLGIQNDIGIIKDENAETLRVAIRSIMTMAENKFGKKSAKVRRFRVFDLSNMNDAELHRCAKRVKRVATEYLTLLDSEGLTALIITDLETKNQTFEDSIEEHADAIADRDIAQEDRVEKANALYTQMEKHCNTGKDIWETTNAAKANDYIIYPSEGGNGTEPIDLIILIAETKNAIERIFNAEDEITIANTGTGDLDVGLVLLVDDVVAPGAGVTVAAGATEIVTASQLGDVPQNHFLNVTNNGAVDGSCTITIGE